MDLRAHRSFASFASEAGTCDCEAEKQSAWLGNRLNDGETERASGCGLADDSD
jgi:hypothetical protein